MIFRIDLSSSVPVYRQMCDQVKHAVASGSLVPGDALPTIREVAAAARVNRNTVARSYMELEREGVIVARPGQGSFIAGSAPSIQKRERVRLLEEMVRKLLVEAYHFQIPPEEVRTIFDRVEARLGKEKKS
jgi:GntR family transcriptional regulator